MHRRSRTFLLLAPWLLVPLVAATALAGGPDRWASLLEDGTRALQARKLGEAEAALSQAWELVRSEPAGDARVLRTARALSSALRLQRKHQEAVPVLEVLVAGERSANPERPDAPAFDRAVHQLTEAYRRIGALDEATSLLTTTLATKELALGPKHPALLSTLNDLAVVHTEARRFEAAIAVAERARTLARGAAGLGSGIILHAVPDRGAGESLATALHVLGNAYAAAGRHAEAEPVLRQAVELAAGAWGPRDPRTREATTALARCLRDLGRAAEAAKLEATLEP
jgi:tetratricopeptide (TPR) repeat protein